MNGPDSLHWLVEHAIPKAQATQERAQTQCYDACAAGLKQVAKI
jgi:hypothetical protein